MLADGSPTRITGLMEAGGLSWTSKSQILTDDELMNAVVKQISR